MSSAVLLLSLLSVSSPSGPSGDDARWLPFLGCWSLVEDRTEQPLSLEPEESLEAEPAPRGLVCLTPEGESVRVRTFADDEAFLEETLVADGERREVTEGTCRGWESAVWSGDGRRLYTRSELTCEDGRKRSVSGVSLIDDLSVWIEIQAVGSGDARAVVLRRYRSADEDVTLAHAPELSPDDLRETSRARAASGLSRLSIDDVIEASRALAPEALEAMLVERSAPFAIDREELIRLDDASVPPRVIDLMVALSFPERFVVEREPAGGGGGFGRGPSRIYDPFFTSAYAYPYYFAPFGYYYWYAPWDPVWAVRPIDLPGASVGRVIAGRGYTQVSRVQPDGGGGGRRAKHRGSGDDWSSGGKDAGSSSSGTASPGGYSRGGSEGRTAKPKQK